MSTGPTFAMFKIVLLLHCRFKVGVLCHQEDLQQVNLCKLKYHSCLKSAAPKAMAGFTTQCCAQAMMKEVLILVKGIVGVL